MEFITARDFRVRPGTIWKRLKESGRVVITLNGKPMAIMKDVEGHDLEEEWRTEIIADGIAALSRVRASAQRTGAQTMTPEDIENEIKAAREKM